MTEQGFSHAQWPEITVAQGAEAEVEPEQTQRTATQNQLSKPASQAISPAPKNVAPALKGDLPQDRYSDRELSWLAFNKRVLDLAQDRQRIPLLERARFLSIFSSNLDEFFMVRVAGLKRRIDAGVATPSIAGQRPRELHDQILTRSHELVAEQSRLFHEEVLPELTANGIEFLRWKSLTDVEKQRMDELFTERIYPVLTPLAVDPSHPFPYVSGLSLNIAVLLLNPTTKTRQFARIKVPTILDRLIKLSDSRYVPLEEVILSHLSELFTGMKVLRSTTFRVTRNEDVAVEEDDAENLLDALEKELLRSKVGRPPVRLEVEDTADYDLLEMLTEALDITPKEIFRLPAPLDLTLLSKISRIDREDLRYPNFLPKTHPDLAPVETSSSANIFKAIRHQDVLLHHPYDSFATSVQRFIEQAAADPQVLAIKQTLYRTSGDSPIIDALIEAAEAGKQVLAIVEIKARFDEKNNIAWARKLERHGVHVVYGMIGLKTHCKLILVVREEAGKLRRYAHISTGNYNPKTARQYDDMGLLTCNPVVTDDVSRMFNHLSGMTQEENYRRLQVSPAGVRNGLVEAIETEIEHHKAGRPARVRIKTNAIIDEVIIDALYKASKAGVPVDLWVRGICGIRPGVPGLSDNIRVISILGRFLEHSRAFWFENGGDPYVGIGSPDLMHRNLDRRVEAIVLITHPQHIVEIGELFDAAFNDDTVHWALEDRDWRLDSVTASGQPKLDLHQHLIEMLGKRRNKNDKGPVQRSLFTTSNGSSQRRTLASPRKTTISAAQAVGTIVLTRHGEALPRAEWYDDDPKRPLTLRGELQADKLVELLRAHDVKRVVSSTSMRCLQTVIPYAAIANIEVEGLALLSEESAVGRETDIIELMASLRILASKPPNLPIVICGHRPVLGVMQEGLHIKPRFLLPGQSLIIRIGSDGEPVSVESHVSPVETTPTIPTAVDFYDSESVKAQHRVTSFNAGNYADHDE